MGIAEKLGKAKANWEEFQRRSRLAKAQSEARQLQKLKELKSREEASGWRRQKILEYQQAIAKAKMKGRPAPVRQVRTSSFGAVRRPAVARQIMPVKPRVKSVDESIAEWSRLI